MKRIFKKIGISIVLLLVIVGILSIASFSYNTYAVNKWLQNPQPPGQLVNIGSHRLFTTIKGEKSPAVIMLPGMNAFSWGWREIQDEIAKISKAVTYDRSGYGWSEASPELYSSKQIVTELHTLLQRLEITPPYILVGASMGGVYAKHFASLYRIDDNHYLNAPDGFPDIPVRVIVQDVEITIRDAVRYKGIKGGKTEKEARAYLNSTKERQRNDYMALSANSEWILAVGSGHNIQFDRPYLIIKTISDLIIEIRK
jgi:pimeloyl-ACP methyl ester carboxylesterase